MADLAPGALFAGCRIEGVLGRGGMGVIYRATELRLGRPVALKLVSGDGGDDAADRERRERFEREARLTASIEHPNVIPVYGAGEEDGCLYLIMRYVPGTDLQALLRREGRLRPGRAADIIAQVADGLDAAHAAGLVHRDVKPANVLLADDHVYLSDFGITRVQDGRTRITESGAWVGTVDFMAPEHLRGEPTDARSDVYALGCLLYTTLTGEPPFRRETVPATITAHLHDVAPRPSATPGVPTAFDTVVARALAKDPADRYASAGDLGRAAIAAATGHPIDRQETSVARGAARPLADEQPTRVVVAAPTALAEAPERTRVAPVAASSPTPAAGRPVDVRVQRGRGRRRALAATIAVLALPAAALIAWTLGGGGRTSHPSGPLTTTEVRAVARAFATAYSDENAVTLRRLLDPSVKRVSASDAQTGRAAVVSEYQRQFDADAVQRYALSELQVTGGRVGRAEGRYTVTRAGRGPLRGRLVLGVVRRPGGAAAIALIATEARP